MSFYPNFGDDYHDATVKVFGSENFNKLLRGNLGYNFFIFIYFADLLSFYTVETDIIFYKFMQNYDKNKEEEGFQNYHSMMLTSSEESFECVKDGLTKRLFDADKLFNQIKL